MRMWNCDDPVEDWWHRNPDSTSGGEPFPGNLVLFVGAGISVYEPTGLPQGQSLTRALVNHLLDQRAAAEVSDVFEKCSTVLGRNVPRLEHILDVACNDSPASIDTTSPNPKSLLRLFANRRPNCNHRLIAKHLAERRGWVITTNFDDCIETAYFEATGKHLPVHILSQDTPTTLEVLNGSPNESWGLVKPHGTIEQGVERLAATLGDLVPRLATPFRSLLSNIFDSADLIVVAGYSGSDHFDINAWIRNRVNARHKPRLIWLKHSSPTSKDVVNDEQTEPYLSWRSACGGFREFRGETTKHLGNLLHQDCSPEPSTNTSTESESLLQQLSALYTPTDDQRHLNGARFCIAIGLGQLAEEELRRFNHRKVDEEKEVSLLPTVYARMGLYSEARRVFAWLRHHLGKSVALQRVKLFRHENRPFRALLEVANSALHADHYKLSVSEKIELRFEAVECFLDIVEASHSYAIFRTKPLRRLTEFVAQAIWPPTEAIVPVNFSLALEGKMQILALRGEVLFNDDYLSSWRLLKEQFSAPELQMKSGPAIPGYYLVGLSTCKEEDRLADLVEMKLVFVRILLSAIRRNWPRGAKSSDKGIDWIGETYVWLLQRFLSIADEIARGLDEPHLLVAVAKCRVKADKVLRGFSYWRRQRLYLGG